MGLLLGRGIRLPVCAGARLVYVRRSLPLAGKEEKGERDRARVGRREECALAVHPRDHSEARD